MRVRTDEETTENVTLRHPGTDDPSAFFRVAGRAERRPVRRARNTGLPYRHVAPAAVPVRALHRVLRGPGERRLRLASDEPRPGAERLGLRSGRGYLLHRLLSVRGAEQLDARARGRAHGARRVGVGELHALRRHTVEMRRAVKLAAITAEVALPEVIKSIGMREWAHVGRCK